MSSSTTDVSPRRGKRDRKKKLKDELLSSQRKVARLEGTVARMCEENQKLEREIDSLRMQVTSLQYTAYGQYNGRNKMKKKNYVYDNQNDNTLSRFIRTEVFPSYKFPRAWMFAWAPNERTSLCGRVFRSLALPEGSKKVYWETRAVGMMGKAWTESTSNINAAIKKQFAREFTSPHGTIVLPRIFSISYTSLRRRALPSTPLLRQNSPRRCRRGVQC